MQITTVGTYPITLGSLIALVILLVVIVLWITNAMDAKEAALIGGLAVARLT